MTPEWERYAAGETYREVEGLLRKFAGQTAARFNLDFDAAMSAANLGFVQAFRSFRPELGNEFITWAGELAKKRLQTFVKKELEYARKPLVQVEDQGRYAEVEKRVFDLEGFLSGLSPAAQQVAKLVFDTPPDVLLSMGQIGKDDPEAFRNAVREFLQEQGWSKRKIRNTFLEVREAL